jgi:hypothetical protein
LRNLRRTTLLSRPALAGRRPIVTAVATVVTGAALVLGTAAPAMAATTPPTVTGAFTPSEIGVGDSTATALSVTITNPNASASLSGVSFTDTLPAGLTVDNPNGENGTCGTGSVVTANPGSSTFSLTGGTLKAATNCVISVSLIASQTGVLQNSTGPVSSSAGSAAGDTESLTVLPPPTVTVHAIKNNARYTFGEVVKPTYVCAQSGDATALADCSAVDDLGNSVASGRPLATKQAGAHSLTVTSTSSDGLSTTDTFNYTVLPDNRFTVTTIKPKSAGTLSFKLRLPGPGKIKVVELALHNVIVGKGTVSVGAQRTVAVKISPGPAGRALLRKAKSTQSKPPRISLQVTYTPKGGVAETVVKRGLTLL